MAAKHKSLARRIEQLDGTGAPTSGEVWISLVIENCSSQEEYDRCFEQGWKQVPQGAAVFYFPAQSDEEWCDELRRFKEGLPPLIDYRCGIYLKELATGAE